MGRRKKIIHKKNLPVFIGGLVLIFLLFITVPSLRHSVGLYSQPWYQSIFSNDPDGDGLPTREIRHLDRCPYSAEDYDGDRDHDGCPDYKHTSSCGTKHDLSCPTLAKECCTQPSCCKSTCPPPKPPPVPPVDNTDTDGDGIPDRLDACPDAPEDFNGFSDKDGCPEGERSSCEKVTVVDKMKLWK